MQKKLTNEQILHQAIEKAEKNGYISIWWKGEDVSAKKAFENTIEFKIYYSIIFSHDFAEKFWGNKEINMGIELGTNRGEIVSLKNWQYHLQQIILTKEPLKYIEKFL